MFSEKHFLNNTGPNVEEKTWRQGSLISGGISLSHVKRASKKQTRAQYKTNNNSLKRGENS